MLTSEKFIQIARLQVFDMARQSLDPTDNVEFTLDDVYEVTHSFVCGYQKAMLSTTLPDGKYYEVTYNAEKNELYVDQYVRTQQKTLSNIIV